MIEILNQESVTNNDIKLESLSYELASNLGDKRILCQFLISDIEIQEIFINSKISFGFSYTEDFDLVPTSYYKEENTYDLIDVATQTNNSILVNVEVDLKESFDSLSSYVKIYNEGNERNYSKVFKDVVIRDKSIVSKEFVDYTIADETSYPTIEKTPFELQEEFFEKDFNKNNNYSYMTDLFFHFKTDNTLGCFFGIDSISFAKDNNSVEFLNKNKEFNDYLKTTPLVENILGYFYNDNENIYISPSAFDSDLKQVLGDTYAASLKIPKDFDRTNKYGYDVKVSFVDATVQYLNNILLPALRSENNFLSELQINNGSIIEIFSFQTKNTIETFKDYIRQTSENIDDVFKFYDNSESINLNDEVRRILLNLNEKIYNVLLNSLEAKHVLDNTDNSINKDFGRIIDISKINFGVNVLEEKGQLVGTFSREELLGRGLSEASKYFSEEQIVNNYFGYLTSLNVVIDGAEVLNNESSPLEEFSYDDTLRYLNSFNDIINKNIDKDPIVYPSKKIDGLSKQEVLTEDRTEQNNFTLNSLSVTQNISFRTALTANSALAIKDNIVKTFQVPTTLTTNLCDGPIRLDIPENEALTKRTVDKESFIGNSLIAYALLNRIKALHNNYFYEPYYAIEEATDQQDLPIQAQFLSSFYSTNTGDEQPAYLRRENLLNQITNFGLIYHNFKSVFCVKVYSEEDSDFVVLDYDKLTSLEENTNHLCFIDTYKNASYGIETPELLRTSIYNRYFILAV
jgi:hypothetical protein